MCMSVCIVGLRHIKGISIECYCSLFKTLFIYIHIVYFFIGARTLRVWSREGVLSSTSEVVDGLEQALFWK